MDIKELARQVIRALENRGPDATITLVMPGRWGKSDTKRLCPDGPKGRIVSDTPGGLIVSFSAFDLSAFLAARGILDVTIVQRDGVPGGVMTFRLAE